MRGLGLLLMLGLSLIAADSRGADAPRPSPTVKGFTGYLFDEGTGAWSGEDVFDPRYVPFNKLGVPLMVVATVDLGEGCAIRKPSAEEAQAIAKGERPPFARPKACEKPTGTITWKIKHGDGQHERQVVTLSKFFTGADGKIHVPFLFYRRLPCLPVELSVQTSSQARPIVKKVDFVCKE